MLRRASAGRHKKSEPGKPVPCLFLAARLPRPWPRTEWGGSAGRKQSEQTSKRDHPRPSTERGVGRTGNIENKRTNQAAQPNHAKDAPNPDSKIPEHLKEPKKKDGDLKTQKRSEATQGVISNLNAQTLPEGIQGGEAKTRKTVERGGDLKVN